jgi:hypothetical protein
MCDFSLEQYRSRKAMPGEELLLTRFPRGSVGMTASGKTSKAVCVLPGTKGQLTAIPAAVQEKYGVKETESVEFETKDRPNTSYRDGVLFANGASVLLQELEGATLKVNADVRLEEETAAQPPTRRQRVRERVGAMARSLLPAPALT